jgi:hypothetical protein
MGSRISVALLGATVCLVAVLLQLDDTSRRHIIAFVTTGRAAGADSDNRQTRKQKSPRLLAVEQLAARMHGAPRPQLNPPPRAASQRSQARHAGDHAAEGRGLYPGLEVCVSDYSGGGGGGGAGKTGDKEGQQQQKGDNDNNDDAAVDAASSAESDVPSLGICVRERAWVMPGQLLARVPASRLLCGSGASIETLIAEAEAERRVENGRLTAHNSNLDLDTTIDDAERNSRRVPLMGVGARTAAYTQLLVHRRIASWRRRQRAAGKERVSRAAADKAVRSELRTMTLRDLDVEQLGPIAHTLELRLLTEVMRGAASPHAAFIATLPPLHAMATHAWNFDKDAEARVAKSRRVVRSMYREYKSLRRSHERLRSSLCKLFASKAEREALKRGNFAVDSSTEDGANVRMHRLFCQDDAAALWRWAVSIVDSRSHTFTAKSLQSPLSGGADGDDVAGNENENGNGDGNGNSDVDGVHDALATCLAPLVDMFDHHPAGEAVALELYDANGGDDVGEVSLVVRAQRPYHPLESVPLNYGAAAVASGTAAAEAASRGADHISEGDHDTSVSLAHQLFTFGFMYGNNGGGEGGGGGGGEVGSVIVPGPFPDGNTDANNGKGAKKEDSPFYTHAAGKHCFALPSRMRQLHADGAFPLRLLDCYRLRNLDADEWYTEDAGQRARARMLPYTLANERAALRHLVADLRSEIAQITSTSDEDAAVARGDTNASPTVRAIALLRKRERGILERHIAYFDAKVAELTDVTKAFEGKRDPLMFLTSKTEAEDDRRRAARGVEATGDKGADADALEEAKRKRRERRQRRKVDAERRAAAGGSDGAVEADGKAASNGGAAAGDGDGDGGVSAEVQRMRDESERIRIEREKERAADAADPNSLAARHGWNLVFSYDKSFD